MALDPVDLVGECAVEQTGVVGTNGQSDIRGQETMHRMIFGIGHRTDAQVGGRAGLDDRAERS